MTSRTKTIFSLFIIESLRFVDEKKLWFEGKLLRDILRMSRQIEVEYLYIRTRKELFASLNPPIDIPAHVRVITTPPTSGAAPDRGRKGSFLVQAPKFFLAHGNFSGSSR